MSDLEQNIKNQGSQGAAGVSTSAPALSPLQTPQTDTALEIAENLLITDEREKNGHRTKTTGGEHVHKWGTYLSVDWVLNAAFGVGFSYLGEYSKLGKQYWSGPIKSGFKKALSVFTKNEAHLAEGSRLGNIFMSIIAGGMFTIPPLLVLENNKIKTNIVKFFDGMIYGKDKVENDPNFQQAYDEIEHAPKKNFVNGMISRFLALSPLLAMILYKPSKAIANKVWFNHVENASAAVANKIGFSEKSFKSLAPEAAKERWKFIHENVAMDFGLGVPYAIMHSFFYNTLSNFFHKPETDKAPEAAEAPAVSQTDESAAKASTFTQNIKAKAPLAEPKNSYALQVAQDAAHAETSFAR